MPKKVRVWFRKDRARWYGEYWESGRRHAKAFRNRTDANLWKRYMEHKFDAAEWRGVTGLAWQAATSQFLAEKQLRSAQGSLEELHRSLEQFEKLVGPLRTDLINTAHVENFIQRRQAAYAKGRKTRQVSPNTINKDLRNLNMTAL